MAVLIEESREHLENIEPDFLTMESECANTSPDLINRVFRAMHSIKGGFGFFGMTNIVNLAHIMENVLMRVRDGEAAVDAAMVSALIEGADILRSMIDDVESSQSQDIQEIITKLTPFTEGGHSPEQSKLQEDGASIEDALSNLDELDEKAKESVRSRVQVGEMVYLLIREAEFDAAAMSELDMVGERLFEGKLLGKNAIVCASIMDKEMMVALGLGEGVNVHDLGAGEIPTDLKPVEAPVAAVAAPVKSGSDKSAAKKSVESIRVRTELLSQLVDTAGEMVLGRNRIMSLIHQNLGELPGFGDSLNQLKHQLEQCRQLLADIKGDTAPKDGFEMIEKEFKAMHQGIADVAGTKIADAPGIGAMFQVFSTISSDLQNGIMNTRLQPVSAVFSKFPRVIRDMNKKLGKEIELLIEGGEVELDKSVIEGLGDPLTHLVRNSADHGVESPDERERVGKSRQGTVKLIARHEAGHVHIIIEDDGAGINVDRIKEKAVENGMMSQDEADALPDKEAFKLIFAAGFSTAKVVSDVSGRGVGMDVVRTNIEKLGGRIDIDSIRGNGTTLTLVMPLTLAIIPSLGVTAGGQHYDIPQVEIEEMVRVTPDEFADRIAKVNGSPVLKLREFLLPLVRLTDVLEQDLTYVDDEGGLQDERRKSIADRRSEELNDPDASKESPSHSRVKERRDIIRGKMYIVVLKAMGSRYGLVVDKLHEPQEVVVKPLSSRLKDIGVYAGATIRSNGQVSLILDAEGLAQEAQIRPDVVVSERKSSAHANIKESQTMLEFSFGSKDRFALNLSMVARVEEITKDQLHETGGQEFLRYDNSSLRVIRIHDFLNVTPPDEIPERLFVLVPRLVPHPMGILMEKPKGIFTTEDEIQTDQMWGAGIHGTQVVDSRLIIFLDLYSLFERAAPELYASQKEIENHFREKRVLLAEDTALFQTVIGNFLETIFNHVDVVANGQEAWEKLQKESYDLLVTDIVMPVMDGMQLTQQIRSHESLRDLPVIAVTSLMNEVDKERIVESGVSAYEAKLDKEGLMQSIRDLLGGDA